MPEPMVKGRGYDRSIVCAQDFISLVHDFVQAYPYKNASTEGLKAVVDNHMKPGLDAAGDHRSDWLFRDWIYGAGLPKYHFEYSAKNADCGKVALEGKLTQSEVPADFLVTVLMYFDFDGLGSKLASCV